MKSNLGLTTLSFLGILALAACSGTDSPALSEAEIPRVTEPAIAAGASLEAGNLKAIDPTKWQYNQEADVYYQTGLAYAGTPVDGADQTMGIFIPGKYFDAKANGDGTYTVNQTTTNKVGRYTAENAPWVMPVNTPGYSAMAAPTGFDDNVKTYTDEGLIYLAAGARGRESGAPSGVTDLKAAIRYARVNAEHVAGNPEKLYVFGMSGGGAQSAILGTSGDSHLYESYLKHIGAVEGVSDAVAGVMAWSPITSLDYANAAYEWQFGSARTGLNDETKALSDGLAEAFATHINRLSLVDENGKTLSLDKSDKGIYQAGTYYEYITQLVEDSLNKFLATTTWPYTVPERQGPPHGQGAPRNSPNGSPHASPQGAPNGPTPPSVGSERSTNAPNSPSSSTQPSDTFDDQINRITQNTGLDLSGKTFNSIEEYISALNTNGTWVTYDSSARIASITDLSGFIKNLKTPSKAVGAFDALDLSQGENELFGYGDGNAAHYDPTMAALLDGTRYEDAFSTDLERLDRLGTDVSTRVAMYTPLYFINNAYQGYKSAKVAPAWRIRSGINQGDTALTTEANLALALKQFPGVKDVDFATIWGQGHTKAEEFGDPTTQFITWVHAQASD